MPQTTVTITPPFDGDYTTGYAFHFTSVENALAIRENGFNPHAHDTRTSPDEQLLHHIAARRPDSLPIDRTNATFFFLTHTTQRSPIDTAVIVINLDALTNPLCVADMDAYDALLDTTPIDWPNTHPIPQSARDAAHTYLDTLTPATTRHQIDTAAQSISTPELIVEGSIPPDAIHLTILPNWNAHTNTLNWTFDYTTPTQSHAHTTPGVVQQPTPDDDYVYDGDPITTNAATRIINYLTKNRVTGNHHVHRDTIIANLNISENEHQRYHRALNHMLRTPAPIEATDRHLNIISLTCINDALRFLEANNETPTQAFA